MHEGNGLVKTIEIKDRDGRVVETKEVVTYAGLLNRAHQEGLKQIRTKLVQTPSPANEMTAISLAEVVTDKGVFRDYGDANPANVNGRIVPHIIRMSVTRAKARALRDAINVGVVSMEELGQEYQNGNSGRPQNGGHTDRNGSGQPQRPRQSDADKPMTDYQRKYLFQLLKERGKDVEAGHTWLCEAAGVDSLKKITKKQASEFIDRLVKEAPSQTQTPTSRKEET